MVVLIPLDENHEIVDFLEYLCLVKVVGCKGSEEKKYCKPHKETYSSYIYKVLKQVHMVYPDTGMFKQWPS